LGRRIHVLTGVIFNFLRFARFFTSFLFAIVLAVAEDVEDSTVLEYVAHW